MRGSLARLPGKSVAIALALASCAAFTACGETHAKRSVDARTEVLHFYAVDAPVVALLRPDPAAAVAALDQAASELGSWQLLRERVTRRLEAAGLDLDDLRELVRPNEEIEGIDAAALGLGAPTPTDLKARQSLLVLATDQADLLSDLVGAAVKAGRLQPAGELDEAHLYSNRVAAYAERDGVLVSASSMGVVRSALARRDGDSDQQLDEDQVASVLGQLNDRGPLEVYANAPEVSAEPDVPGYLPTRSLLDAADDAGASVRAVGATVEISAVVDLVKAPEDASGLLGSEGAPFDLLVPGLGAVNGETSISGNQVRLEMKVVPGPLG